MLSPHLDDRAQNAKLSSFNMFAGLSQPRASANYAPLNSRSTGHSPCKSPHAGGMRPVLELYAVPQLGEAERRTATGDHRTVPSASHLAVAGLSARRYTCLSAGGVEPAESGTDP